MSKEKKSSGVPMAIIGLVLIIVVAAGAWMYTTSKPGVTPPKANANGSTNANKATAPTNAPAGAQPPNQVGSPAATVTIEEFADFQCGSCANAHPVLNEIKSLYGMRIRFIFRNYPLSIPAHDKAYDAAVVAEAAGVQGKFWDMQNLLFTNQAAWTSNPNYKQIWKEYAQKIGLDIAKFETDSAGVFAKGRVDADLARGRGMNVNSTPTVFINGINIPFDQLKVDTLKKVIDAELQKAPAPGTASTSNTTSPPDTANTGNAANPATASNK